MDFLIKLTIGILIGILISQKQIKKILDNNKRNSGR